MILFCQRVRLCAEGKRPGGHSAAHPMADTQSGGGAAEDQSRCEKGQQFVSWNTEVHAEAAVRQRLVLSLLQKCELRKRMGIAGMCDTIMAKISTPFQPDVPNLDTYKDSQTRTNFKTLKHAFIRDKLYL